MAINNLDYAEAAGLLLNNENLAFVERVRAAGAWLRNRAYKRYLQGDRSDADRLAWTRCLNASHRWEEAQTARRRIIAPGRQEMPCAAVQARQRLELKLRSASPMRPIARTAEPVDGLALFDAVRSPELAF